MNTFETKVVVEVDFSSGRGKALRIIVVVGYRGFVTDGPPGAPRCDTIGGVATGYWRTVVAPGFVPKGVPRIYTLLTNCNRAADSNFATSSVDPFRSLSYVSQCGVKSAELII